MNPVDSTMQRDDSDLKPMPSSAGFPLQELHGCERVSPLAFRDGNIGKSKYFNFVWLIYSAFFVIVPYNENTLQGWTAFAAAYLSFLALYFGIYNISSHRKQQLLLAALYLLGCVYVPFNAGACGIFIYVSAFAPFCLDSDWLAVAVTVVAGATAALEGLLQHQSPWGWGICAAFSIAVGIANIGVAQRIRAGWKLGLAHEQIAHLAKVAERERIARDLHDVLGHTLSVVVLKSELAGKLMERDPERARQEMAEVEQIARQALGDVRETIRGYRAEGLETELARARKTLDAAGVLLELTGNTPTLAPAEETVLSLILREAVTNIVRHAQASRCRMALATGSEGTALVVEDDGRGGIRMEGNGLRGMRERVESLGGKLSIISVQGTRLEVHLPSQELIKA